MDDTTLLRNSELFSALLDDDVIYLLTKTEELSCQAGSFVFRAGEASGQFFIVKSGEVEITQVTEDGNKHVLARYIKGDSFGEFDFVTGFRHDAEARVTKDCILLVFPAKACRIDNIVMEKPGTLSRLYLRFLALLSRRLRSVHNLIAENSVWVKQLQEEVYIDQHTGLFTRPYLDTEIPKQLAPPACLLMVKPDRFKEINDSYGHQAGDVLLERLATILLQVVAQRPHCWAVRIRSNEMALVLRDSPAEEAKQLARRICKAAAGIGPGRVAAAGNGSDVFRLTMSMAIGRFDNVGQSWGELVDRTYNILKRAWADGGNRVYMLKVQ